MNKYSGGNFDDFLREEGIFEEVVECTRKRLLASQIEDCINGANRKETPFAVEINIGFVQLNHYLFDIDNTVITSELLNQLILEAKEISTNHFYAVKRLSIGFGRIVKSLFSRGDSSLKEESK